MTKPAKKPSAKTSVEDDVKAYAAALGRLGGSKNTPAQNAARAKNGRKGGRPKVKKGTP